MIPFVFYHGEILEIGPQFWRSLQSEWRGAAGVAEYIADFQSALFELNDANLDAIMRDAALRTLIEYIMNTASKNRPRKLIEHSLRPEYQSRSKPWQRSQIDYEKKANAKARPKAPYAVYELLESLAVFCHSLTYSCV